MQQLSLAPDTTTKAASRRLPCVPGSPTSSVTNPDGGEHHNVASDAGAANVVRGRAVILSHPAAGLQPRPRPEVAVGVACGLKISPWANGG